MKIKTALCAVVLGLASPAGAQMVPLDLISPYEAARIVRSTGLIPVAPPMQSGASYMVRAVDRFGTPVRVFVGGRDGRILAVQRVAMQPPGFPYPPRPIAPRSDPDVTGSIPPGAYPPAARLDRPPYEDGPATPPRIAPNTVVPAPPKPHAAAVAPARPPVPRPKPSAPRPAEAAVKPAPAPEAAPAAPASPAPSETEPAPANPGSTFPPVQSLE